MNQQIDYTPAALYARVSSDRQDMDLSVAAQLRALRDYAEKNGYVVAREYIDEAERGRIADMPQFHKLLNEASGPNAPSRRFSSGSSPALPESASIPWPSSPCSAAGEAGAVLAGRRGPCWRGGGGRAGGEAGDARQRRHHRHLCPGDERVPEDQRGHRDQGVRPVIGE